MVPPSNIIKHTYLLLQEDMEGQNGEKSEVSGHAATVRLLRTSNTAMLEERTRPIFICPSLHFIEHSSGRLIESVIFPKQLNVYNNHKQNP